MMNRGIFSEIFAKLSLIKELEENMQKMQKTLWIVIESKEYKYKERDHKIKQAKNKIK